MRYIRTEKGFILDTQNTLPYMLDNGYIDFNSGGMFKIKSTSDTIEELCDEFVIIKVNDKFDEYIHSDYYNDKKFYIYNTDEGITLNEVLRHNYIVYGAIWTDKGLIYVAKLRGDKGKWEYELL